MIVSNQDCEKNRQGNTMWDPINDLIQRILLTHQATNVWYKKTMRLYVENLVKPKIYG